MSEDAANTHEGQYTVPRTIVISRRDVQAFVAQHVTHDLLPPVLMTEGAMGVRFHEAIPLLRTLIAANNPQQGQLTDGIGPYIPSVVPIG